MTERPLPKVLYVIADELWLSMTPDELQKTMEGLRACNLYHEPAPQYVVRVSLDALYHDKGAPEGHRPNNDNEQQFMEFEFTMAGEGLRYTKRRLLRTHYRRASDHAKKALLSQQKHDLRVRRAELVAQFGQDVWGEAEWWWEDDWLCGRWLTHTGEQDWPVLIYAHEVLIALLATRNVERGTRYIKHPTARQMREGQAAPPYKRETILHCPSPVYEPNVPGGGNHHSPKMHFRHGHLRSQHHGPGNTLIKDIWISPVMVMATADAPVTPPMFRLVK